MEPLDEVDLKIIAELKKDSRISGNEVARRIGLSSAATARRIKSLIQNGVIKDYTITINQEKLGRVECWFWIDSVTEEDREKLFDILSKVELDEMTEIEFGQDFVIKVYLEEKKIDGFIWKLKEVGHVEKYWRNVTKEMRVKLE